MIILIVWFGVSLCYGAAVTRPCNFTTTGGLFYDLSAIGSVNVQGGTFGDPTHLNNQYHFGICTTSGGCGGNSCVCQQGSISCGSLPTQTFSERTNPASGVILDYGGGDLCNLTPRRTTITLVCDPTAINPSPQPATEPSLCVYKVTINAAAACPQLSNSVTPTVTPSLSLSPSVSPTRSPSLSATPTYSPGPGCGQLPIQPISVSNLTGNFPLLGSTAIVTCTNDDLGPITSYVVCTSLEQWSVSPAVSCAASPSCAGDGIWFTEGECVVCPKGCVCPGGTRIWPAKGYWSPDEQTKPLLCRNPDACIGAGAAPILLDSDGHRVTTQCTEGYRGEYCSLCAVGYYKASDACLQCPGGGKTTFVILALVAVAVFGTLSFGVVLLKDQRLDTMVAIVVAIQQFCIIGSMASARLASVSPGAAKAFSSISLISFNVEFVNPECEDSGFNFVLLFWCTLGVLLIVIVMFVGAAAIYAFLLTRHARSKAHSTPAKPVMDYAEEADGEIELETTEEQVPQLMAGEWTASPNEETPDGTQIPQVMLSAPSEGDKALSEPPLETDWRKLFRRRAIRALFILVSLTYLQMCTRATQGVTCVQGRLKIELATECYEGRHLGASPIIWLMLIFVIAYPIYCLFKLTTLARRDRLAEFKVMTRYGFLYRGLRPRFYWFRLIPFFNTFVLTLEAATLDSVTARIFTASILFEANALLITFLWPFIKWQSNAFNLTVGFVNLLASLALMGSTLTDATRPYFQAGLALALLMSFVVVCRAVWHFFLRHTACGIATVAWYDAIKESAAPCVPQTRACCARVPPLTREFVAAAVESARRPLCPPRPHREPPPPPPPVPEPEPIVEHVMGDAIIPDEPPPVFVEEPPRPIGVDELRLPDLGRRTVRLSAR